MKQIFVLMGEGIECEKESVRFFSEEIFELRVKSIFINEILSEPQIFNQFSKGDVLFIPGGFSFSDHFGSGRLLAYELNQRNVLQTLLHKGVHLIGVCNGFQVLVSAGLFGKNAKLLANEVAGHRLGFVNRWVHLKTNNEKYFLTVRHGEGRFVLADGKFEKHVEPFLFYEDANFSNGSFEQIAGLKAQHGETQVWAMMPHPEVSYRIIDNPDCPGPEFNQKSRLKVFEASFSGTQLMKSILSQL
jgi:phosphoribosylformylglycinamidine (FGAM) synthase-like amidotransferase family enzyme